MKLALFGSTGYVGGQLLKACMDQGHPVRALVRNPQKLGDCAGLVEVIQGDYFDQAKVAETVRGSEIVISTIGPATKRPENIAVYTQSMIAAMKNLVSIMENEKIKKVIWIGGAATPVDAGETFNLRQKLIEWMLNLTARYIIAIKTSEGAILSKSRLDWVIVRPPAVTRGAPTHHVKADAKKLYGMRIDRADLVAFVLEQIPSDRWLHQAPLVCSTKNERS